MRLKALIAACAAAVAALVALTGCSSSEHYTPPEATPVVSSPAIIEDGVLHVGVNASAAPLAGQNSSGELVGFDVDLAAAIADALGLKVDVTDVGANGASALAQGNVDIVLGVEQGSSATEIWESDAYLQTGIVLFASDAKAQVPTKESAPKIAVQTSSTSSWLAENEFGADSLVRVNGLAEAFKALGGQAQYAAADAVRGTYVLSDDDLGVNASIIALMQQPSGYCITLLDSNTQLKQAVADALSSVSDGGLMTVLEKKWLGTEWDLSGVPLTAGATAEPEDEDSEEAEDAAEGESDASAEGASNAVTPEDVAAA